jgi:ABC-type glycerol-3-phosphate transport system substrate-binding protein
MKTRAKAIRLPLPPGGRKANNVLGNISFSALKTSKNPDLAIALAETFAAESQQRFVPASIGTFIPARKSVLQDPNIDLGAFATNEAKSITRVTIQAILEDEEHPTPPFPRNGDRIWNRYNQALSTMTLQNGDPKTVLDALQKEAQDLVSY